MPRPISSSPADWKVSQRKQPRLGPREAGQEVGAQIDQAVLSGSAPARKALMAHVHQLRAAMVPELWNPAPETLALLTLKPEIAATLLGVQPSCRLQLNPETDQRQLGDLDVLAHRMAVIGDQEIKFHETEKEGYLLVNVDALSQGLKKAGVNTPAWQISNSLYDLEERQNPLRLFADSVNKATRKSARTAAQALQSSPPLASVDGPHSLRQVGLIAYCDSDESLQKFVQSLVDWDSNFATFGHPNRTLRICDDSPEPYASAMRKACDEFDSQVGTRVEYLGRPEKEEVRQAMVEAIMASPTLTQLQAAGEAVNRSTIEAMTRGMFGGQGPDGYRSGPTENRNLSTLLLQGSRSFQADHDMLPWVETSTADRLRRSLGWEAPPTPARTLTTPVDLLSQLQHEKGDRISSPQFCGAVDPPINLIVEASLLGQGGLASRPVPDAPDQGGRAVDEGGLSGVFRTASPMLLPRQYDQFLPLSPTIRDGDIAVGYLMKEHGGPQARELSRFILHTERAGSKWGGEAHLLRDTIISQALLKTLYNFKAAGAYKEPGPDGMAEALLSSIRAHPDVPEAQEAVTALLAANADLIFRYIANRQERSQALEGLLHNLEGDANQRRRALRQWYRLEDQRADKQGQPHQRHSSSLARQEVEQALQTSRAEAQAMRALHPSSPEEATQLRNKMVAQVVSKLHDYALCLKFRQEILDVTRQFGGPE
jgi:hypothetical protein